MYYEQRFRFDTIIRKLICFLLITGVVVFLYPLKAQNIPTDTLIHADSLVPLPTARTGIADSSFITEHSHRKAVLYSLILPGLGQAYNKKYWKIPFIYGGAGAFLYYVSYNQMQYKKFRTALFEQQVTQDPVEIDGYIYNYRDLNTGRDYFRRYRDISIAGLAAMYLLNVIDAMVDAYFVRYDITDDLTFKMKPAVIQNSGLEGETASLGFRINISF